MAVTVISSVPAYGNGQVTSGSFLIRAPNQLGGTLGVDDIIGLDAALAGKVNDVTTAVGTNITATGLELNALHSAGAINADFIKLHAITASATEINQLVGVTGNVQTQLNSALRFRNFTGLDYIFIGTGAGTGAQATFLSKLLLHARELTLSDFGQVHDDLNMEGFSVLNIVDPVGDFDAANKRYVDAAVAGGISPTFLTLDGRSTMAGALKMGGNPITLDTAGAHITSATDSIQLITGGNKTYAFNDASLDVGSVKITSVADPVSAQDAMTLHYAGLTYLALAGGTMAGTVAMNGNHIGLSADGATFVYSPSNGTFAVSIAAADQFGITASAINAHSKPINNVTDPSGAQDAMTLHYAGLHYLALAGGTMAGTLDMGGASLINSAAPTGGTGIGTRAYNDARYLQIANNLSDGTAATIKTNLGLATVATTGAYSDLTGKPTTVSSVFTRTGSVVAANGDYSAIQITNTPAGNIAAITVQAALNELDTEKLALAGGTMSGALHMGSSAIDGVSTLTAGGTGITASLIQSNPTGSGYYMRSTASGAPTTPTYAFGLATTTGLYWTGAAIGVTIAGSLKYTLGAAALDLGGNKLTSVGTPTNGTDGVNIAYVQALNPERVLGIATGIDLMTGMGSHVTLYTVPAGLNHIITKIIIIATSFTPGSLPVVNPVVSIGVTSNFDQIASNTTLNWGATGAADQAVYVTPNQGATVVTSTSVVAMKKVTAAGGTFSALTVDVIVMGILR